MELLPNLFNIVSWYVPIEDKIIFFAHKNGDLITTENDMLKILQYLDKVMGKSHGAIPVHKMYTDLYERVNKVCLN